VREKIQGQLAIVIPIALSLCIGGALLWGYVEMVRNRAVSVKAGMDLKGLGNTILSRLQQHLVKPDLTNPNCSDTDVSLKKFRDFFNTVTPQYWQYPLKTTTLDYHDPSQCLLLNSEIQSFSTGSISNLSLLLTVSRMSDPDTASLTSPLQVTLNLMVQPQSPAAVQLKIPTTSATLSMKFMLSAGTLSTYSVILLPDGSANTNQPQIKIVAGGPGSETLEILGKTYHSSPTSPNFDSIVSLADNNVYLDQALDLRSSGFNSSYSNQRIDTLALSRVFRGGVNFGIFSNANPLPLPGEFPPSSSPPQPYLWQQKLDYSYVYTTTYSSDKSYPLPDVRTPLGSNFISMTGVDITGPTPLPVNTYRPSNADNLTILPSLPVLPDLRSTCNPDSGALVQEMIFQRINDDLTLNFSGPSVSPSDNLFCGLVIANSLTINTPMNYPDETYVIYGIIITKKIRFSGAGHLFILNPGNNLTVTGVSLPPGQSQSNIFSQYQSLATNYAHNFFLPIFTDGSSNQSDPNLGNFLPQMSVQPNFGYTSKCPTASDSHWYCMNESFGAPNYQQSLFSPFQDNLAYSLSIMQ
jgi:hypothetical protein